MIATVSMTLLAQQTRDPTRLLLWLGIFIVAVVILGVAIMMVRRRVLGSDMSRETEQGFLDELRQMRDSGKMTKEEYDLARKSLTARLAGKGQPKVAKPSTRPPPPPPGLREDDAHG
ncbi:hypothetical protein PHYC_00414 [Phycisphaerales bacterium]|nr:hypothetical protein PHYC_00414 [Phycisphaerales bacterium]